RRTGRPTIGCRSRGTRGRRLPRRPAGRRGTAVASAPPPPARAGSGRRPDRPSRVRRDRGVAGGVPPRARGETGGRIGPSRVPDGPFRDAPRAFAVLSSVRKAPAPLLPAAEPVGSWPEIAGR